MASSLPRIGVRFEPDWPPEQLPEFARWAEDAGFDELWFSEDLPWSGGIAFAATALAHTTRLHVGLGLLPVVTRNVATTAMEIATLCRIAPGRLTVGLGYGIPDWMDQIGAGVPRRLSAVEEVAVALRRLLAGETVTMSGTHVRLDGVTLGHPPAVAPRILLGTTGSAGLSRAGRATDGIILPEVATPAGVTWARSAAGGSPYTVVFAMTSIGASRSLAVEPVRARVQRVVDFGVFEELLTNGGVTSRQVTDEVVQSVAAAGTVEDAMSAAERWGAAGADVVVLVAGSDAARESYGRFAAGR